MDEKDFVDSAVAKGWERAQGVGQPWGEILDAYKNEQVIKEALRIGAEEALRAISAPQKPSKHRLGA
jgi:hypothetical protein